jgi:hypothetical protein
VKRILQVALYIFTLGRGLAGVPNQNQPNAKALVRQSVVNYERGWREGLQWGYTQNDVTSKGEKEEATVSEIIPLDGTPYERITSKNGEPLPPEEQRKEDLKLEKERRRRSAETPAERNARIQKDEKQQEFMREIPNAYDCRIVGEDTVADRPAWVVTLTPRPGFVPANSHAELLRHVEGKLWIDKQDLQWTKAEAHVIDTITFGLILARIGPGTHIAIEMTRVAPNLWLPSRMTIDGTARVLLFHNRSLNEQLVFSDYRHAPAAPPGTHVARAGH